MNKRTKQYDDKIGKQKQDNVLIEKKVYFLGQWYSTGFDDSACKVWRNQISSTTAGTKNKLKITEAGITFGNKATFFNRSSDVLKLEDIRDFYIGEPDFHIIVCVALVTHTKQRILVFRCNNLQDCEDLVTVYRGLVEGGNRPVPSNHRGHQSSTSGGEIDYRMEVREQRLGSPENRAIDVIPDYEERYHHSDHGDTQGSYFRYGEDPAEVVNQQNNIFREERSASSAVTQHHSNSHSHHTGERLSVPVKKHHQQGPVYNRVEHVETRENMGARQAKHGNSRHHGDHHHHRESRQQHHHHQQQQQYASRAGRVTSSSDDEARQVMDQFDRVVERSASSTSRDSPRAVRKPVQMGGGEVMEKTVEVRAHSNSDARRYNNNHKRDSSDEDYQARRLQEQKEKMALAEQAKLRDEVENLKEQVEQLKFASLQRSAQPQQTVTETTTSSSHHSRSKRHGEKKRKHRRHKKSDTSSATESASSSDEVAQVKAKETSSMEMARREVDDHHKLMVTHHTLDRHGGINQVETFGNYDTRPPPPLPLSEATGAGGQRVTKSAYTKVIKTSSSGGGNAGQIVSADGGGKAASGTSLKLVSSTGGPTYDCEGNPIAFGPEGSSYGHTTYGGGTAGSTSGYVSSTYGTTDRSGAGLRVVAASGATAIDNEGRLINDETSARSAKSTSSYQYSSTNGHGGDHVLQAGGDPYANHLVYGGTTLKRDGGGSGSHYGGSNYHTTERRYTERVTSPPRIEVIPPQPTLITPKKSSSEYGYRVQRDEPDYGGHRVHKVTKHTTTTTARPAEKVYVQRQPTSSRNVVYYVDGHPSPPPQQHFVQAAPIYASPAGYETRSMTRSGSLGTSSPRLVRRY